MPYMIEKHVLSPGTYYTNDGIYRCSEADCVRFARVGNRMVQDGLRPPVPNEHQDDAKPISLSEKNARTVTHNSGWVVGWRWEPQTKKLYARLSITSKGTADGIEDGSIKYVSPEVNRFKDGKGRDWGTVITHVALTPVPVAFDQEPFKANGDGASNSDHVPYAAAAKRFSRGGSELRKPIRFSIANPVKVRLGWTAFQTRTGKVGAKNEKGQKIYGKRAEQALRKAGSAQGKKHIEGQVRKAHPDFTDQEVSAAVERQATPEHKAKPNFLKEHKGKKLPPIKGKTSPKKQEEKPTPKQDKFTGDIGSDKSSKAERLTVPQLQGLNQKYDLDHFSQGVSLTPGMQKNVKAAYGQWMKQSKGNVAKFADTLANHIQADQDLLSKGKFKTKDGKSVFHRMVAYRQMLDMAEKDHGSQQEAPTGDYQRRITSIPKAKRVEHAANNLSAVVHQLANTPEAKQMEGSNRYQELTRTGSRSNEDKRFMKTFSNELLKKMQRGEFDPKTVQPILKNLSDAGMAHITYEDLQKISGMSDWVSKQSARNIDKGMDEKEAADKAKELWYSKVLGASLSQRQQQLNQLELERAARMSRIQDEFHSTFSNLFQDESERVVRLGWTAQKTKKGTIKAVNEKGQSIYGKRAEQALKKQSSKGNTSKPNKSAKAMKPAKQTTDNIKWSDKRTKDLAESKAVEAADRQVQEAKKAASKNPLDKLIEKNNKPKGTNPKGTKSDTTATKSKAVGGKKESKTVGGKKLDVSTAEGGREANVSSPPNSHQRKLIQGGATVRLIQKNGQSIYLTPKEHADWKKEAGGARYQRFLRQGGEVTDAPKLSFSPIREVCEQLGIDPRKANTRENRARVALSLARS